MYNVIRLLYLHNKYSVYGCFGTEYDKENPADVHVIKIHKYKREFWKANCPILLLEEQMAAGGLLLPGAKEAIINEIDAEIADAFSFAKSSPFPGQADWHDLNYSTSSPMADRLLADVESAEFDQNQDMTIPRPY